jgi:hypothetical protein
MVSPSNQDCRVKPGNDREGRTVASGDQDRRAPDAPIP